MTIEKIITIIIGIIICHFIDEALFYKTMKHYCKKNKGECKNCECWSCPKYIKSEKEIEK